MGQDKAGLTLADGTLLEHGLARLRSAGFCPVVAGREAPRGIACVHDRRPGLGPLSGLEAALHSLADDASGGGQSDRCQSHALCLAVDLPGMPASFLRWLWGRALMTGAAVTLPAIHGRPQPLCAVYSAALAPGLRKALESGEKKVLRAVYQAAPAQAVDRFHVENLAAALGWEEPSRWFTNVNTPADWEWWRRSSGPF